MNSKSLNKSLRSAGRAGFTLIEVLISIFLLVVISLAIYNATTNTFKLRDVLAAEADFYGAIRLSMNVLDRDIAMLYSPKIMLPPSTLRRIDPNAPGLSPGAPPPTPQPGQPTAATDGMEAEDQQAIVFGDREKGSQFWGSVLDRTGLRLARFQGNETSMSFVSASNLRVYKDSRESMFLKVVFELITENNPEPELQGTRTLQKRVNSNAFAIEQDDDIYTKKYPLLRGVREIKFGYYNREKEKWDKTWDSDSADYKGIYPDLVRVEIKVVGPKDLKYEGLYKFRPEIPYNGLNPSL